MSGSGDWGSRSDGNQPHNDGSQDMSSSSQEFPTSPFMAGRPRLRLGDAQMIAEQRLAQEARQSANMPADDHGSVSEDVASRLIAALNGDDSDVRSAVPSPQGGANPQYAAGAPSPAPQQAGGRAPFDFRQSAPSPQQVPPMPAPGAPGFAPAGMGGNGAPAGAFAGMPAPVAPMRRTQAPANGLRLRGMPSQGLVAPPISRAQSLYEVLNRSQYTPRPVRQPQFDSGYTNAAAAPSPAYGATHHATQDAPGTGDQPIAQEVQDAINVILQSLPKGANEDRPQEDERAEALRRVRTLRAQLVGLQSKISLASTEHDLPGQEQTVPVPPGRHTGTPPPSHIPPSAPASPMGSSGASMTAQSASVLDFPQSAAPSTPQMPQTTYGHPSHEGAVGASGASYDASGAPHRDYGAEPQAQSYGQTPALPANINEWQDESWQDASMMDDADMASGIYDDELPAGIVPNADDNSGGHGGYLGRIAGVAGGIALAASIVGVAVFVSGNEIPGAKDLVSQLGFGDKVVRDEVRTASPATTLSIDGAETSGAPVVATVEPSASGSIGNDLSLIARDVVGPSNKPIRLALSVGDPTGDTASVIRIKGVPPGATLSGGFNVGSGTWLVPNDKLSDLQMDVPGYFSGKFDLQAQALAGDAVTAVSPETNFTVKIGANRPQIAKSGSENPADAGVTSSTVNQTVPTASTLSDTTKSDDTTKIAALPSQQSENAGSVAQLMRQGDVLLDRKDIIGARKYYRTAADLGSADAALSLGQTYDPAYYASKKMDGSNADTKQALIWYQEALSRGNNTARTMVDRLLKWVQKGSL